MIAEAPIAVLQFSQWLGVAQSPTKIHPRGDEKSMNSPLLMAEEVSQLLRIPTEHVYRLARRGELSSVRMGRYVRFTTESVNQYVNSNLKAGQL